MPMRTTLVVWPRSESINSSSCPTIMSGFTNCLGTSEFPIPYISRSVRGRIDRDERTICKGPEFLRFQHSPNKVIEHIAPEEQGVDENDWYSIISALGEITRRHD